MIQRLKYGKHRLLQGFNLVELVSAILIISVALSGTLIVINLSSKFSTDPMVARQATSIADAYLAEILTKDFPSGFPCAAPSASRSSYSKVCDYQGLVDLGAKDQNGNSISGLGAYTVSVTIDGSTAALGTLTPGTQVVRIDVSVTQKTMPALLISAYKTNH